MQQIYWQQLLSEVKDHRYPHRTAPSISRSKKNKSTRYYLNNPQGGCYFTPRELDIMHLISQRMTVRSTSSALSLSPRTVEYYLKHMRIKCNVSRTKELIDFFKACTIYEKTVR